MNLTLRGCDEDLGRALKREAEKRRVSVNRLILDTLRDALTGGKSTRKYHDLDSLAGTWTAAEAAEFDASVKVFESVDPELWDR